MMNCRDFLVEFEDRRGDLTEAATLHVKICLDCQKTSREQTQVWLMIDNLQRIDAPNDFDFRVKARIANAKPADFQPRFFPALRYVLPLGLVVLILGLAVFNTTYFSGGNASPAMVEIVPQTPFEQKFSPVNSFANSQVVSAANTGTRITEVANVSANAVDKNQERQVIAADYPAKKRVIAPKKNDDIEGGGSRVLSARPPSPAILPFGVNPNKTVEPLPNAGNQTPVTDVQILSFIGIETVSENGGKKVKAVKQNSMAESSGVKAGDVIEAIDEKRIGGEPVQMKTFEVKKLTVVRDTKRIEVVLQNKPN